MKTHVSLTLEERLITEIDEARDLASRSAYIERILQKSMAGRMT